MGASSKLFVRYGVGKGFHLGKVQDAGPITINSHIRVVLGRRNATFVDRVRSEGGCVIHHSSGLSGRSRVLTTGLSRYVLIIAIGCPRASAVFVSHFLTSTRTCHMPMGLVFGGMSICGGSRLRCLSDLVGLCAGVNCPYFGVSTGGKRKVSVVGRRLGKQVALFSKRSKMKGSALVGTVLPRRRMGATRVSTCRGGKVRAAAFSRVFTMTSKNCVVSAPNVGKFKAFSVRRRRVKRCFPRVFGFSTSYGCGGYARERRPNYTIQRTMRRRCVDRSHCASCLGVLRSGRRKGCHTTCWVVGSFSLATCWAVFPVTYLGWSIVCCAWRMRGAASHACGVGRA